MAENYIKTYGTYFDLGFTPQPGYRFVLDFSIDRTDTATSFDTKAVMGMYDSWPNKDSYLLSFERGNRFAVYAGGSYNQNCSNFVLGERMQLEFSDRGVVRDGVTYSVNSQYQAPQRNAWLGVANTTIAGFADQNTYYTWYSVKVYDGDTLIYDLIPYKSNDFGCLKDAITGTIYEANDPTKVEFFGSVEGIEVSQTEFNGGYSTSGTISVMTAGEDDEWHITINGPQFILPNYNTGRGSAEVPFFVFPNSRTDERITTIVYTCGDFSQYVDITQTGNWMVMDKGLKYNSKNVKKVYKNGEANKLNIDYYTPYRKLINKEHTYKNLTYAYTTEMRDKGEDDIYTGIFPGDNTKMRITGLGMGYTHGGVVLGYLGGSGNSFRIIRDSSKWYWDYNNSRLSQTASNRTSEFDIEVGNNYLRGTNGTTNINQTGTTQMNTNNPQEIHFSLGWAKISSVQIWKDDVLVYDAHPVFGGWYDEISGTLTTHTINNKPIIYE